MIVLILLLLLSIIRPFAQLPHTTGNYQNSLFFGCLLIFFSVFGITAFKQLWNLRDKNSNSGSIVVK